ncbi:MAG: hypothetical protein AAF915_06840 [Cyanobacteria bacterium P01_D01_bin.50]
MTATNVDQEQLKLKLNSHLSNNRQQKIDPKLLDNSFYIYQKNIVDSVDFLIANWDFNDTNSKLSKKQSLTEILKASKLAQQREVKPSEKSDFNLKLKYIIPPKTASLEKLSPFTTTLPLNGVPISHLTQWELYSGTNFGDDINTTILGGGIVKLNGQVTESLTRNNIYTVDQKATYLQSQTVRETRKVEVTSNDPQTLLGTQMQMSLTASCVNNENSDDQKCSFTPGIVTDRDSIDPDLFVPTRIVQSSNMGEVVTAESLAVMELPGFQTGANGQEVGLDLYFPNSGTTPGNTQGNQLFYERKEEIDNTQLGLYSQVRQIVKANDSKAVIGRTIRGFGLIADNDNLLLNSAVQLGNFILPDVKPRLNGSSKKVNTNINKNLFIAANNVRLPTNSFTFYHAGIGYANSLKPGIKRRSQIPKANFNSVWIGMSPIIERRIEGINRYQPTGEQRILSEGGGEGGADSNVSLISVANDQTFSTNELKDFYTQIYLTNYAQDVNFVNGSRYVEDIKYYPHISLTGNITGSLDSLKYYGGVITGTTIKGYFGGDYTRKTSGGLTFSTGGIGYINPDRDYFSQLFSNISQKIRLGKKSNLVFSSGLNYALDRENRIGEIESESPASFFTVGAKANLGSFYIGLVNYFEDIFPNSIDNTLLINLGINFGYSFRLTGYYTPVNETSSRSRYGATAKLRLGGKYNSPTLSVSWTNNDYDLGEDSEGNKINFTDNIFKVLFRFGAPGNPFNQVNNKRRLRRKRNNLIDRLWRQRRKLNPVTE